MCSAGPGRDADARRDREKVRSCLERVVRDDPGYGDAWAELTWLTLNEHVWGNPLGPDPLGGALRAAQRAVEADQSNQLALNALSAAHFFLRDLDRSFAEADRAVAMNPNNAFILVNAGERLIFAGEGERGIALVRRAAVLNPQQATFHSIAAYHFQRMEYEKALAAAQKVIASGEFWKEIYIAASYGQLGRQDEARTAVEELLSVYPGFTLQTSSEELRKWNFPDEVTERYLTGLRKAGVPDEPRE